MRGEGLLASATKTYETATNKLNNIRDNIQLGLSDTVKKAFILIEAPLSRALAQANIDVQKTLLGNLPKTPETVRLQTQLDLDAISLKRQELSATNRLINAIDLDRISREKVPLAEKMTTAFKEGNVDEFKRLELEYNKLSQTERAIKDPSGLAKDVKLGNETLSSGAQEAFARNRGLQTQLAALSSQEQSVIINGVVATVAAGFEESRKLQERELGNLKQANLEYLNSEEFLSLSPAQKETEQFNRQQQEQFLQGGIARLGPQQAIATAAVTESEALKLKNQGGKNLAAAAANAVEIAKQELETTKDIEQSNSRIAKTPKSIW
jgi:hypothetical protein